MAEDDSATTNEDVPVTIDVLANDSDPDGDTLSVNWVSQPTNGTASNNGSDVTYTPDPDFNGVDTFTYTASDGNGGAATATVTVNVAAVNDPPVAQDDSAATDEDVPATIPVLSNDSDPDGDYLLVDWVTQPANGTASNNGSDVTYRPDRDFNGIDTFTYVASDGDGTSVPATVTVTVIAVNDPPVAQDDTAVTNEDTPVSIGVLANDSDPDGDTLSVDWVAQPANGAASNNRSDVTYTPDPDFNGADTFTYTIADGNGGTATATVTVTVIAVNDPPLAQDDSSSTEEDTPVIILVLSNDSDPDSDDLSVDGVTQPTNGTASNNGNNVTYIPDTNFHGVDMFTYVASDGNGGTATAMVTVAVAMVNDPPIAEDDTAVTNEDTLVSIAVLGNDTDPDGDSLVIESSTQPLHGATARSGTNIIYTPAPNFNGADTFTYTIADGNGGTATATVSVTVIAVNDPPVAQDDSGATGEDTHTRP